VLYVNMFQYSEDSPVYLWKSWRTVAHEFMFDSVDSIHMMTRGIKGATPSEALRRRTNTLLNIYCNAYEADTAQQLCCRDRLIFRLM